MKQSDRAALRAMNVDLEWGIGQPLFNETVILTACSIRVQRLAKAYVVSGNTLYWHNPLPVDRRNVVLNRT